MKQYKILKSFPMFDFYTGANQLIEIADDSHVPGIRIIKTSYHKAKYFGRICEISVDHMKTLLDGGSIAEA